MPLVTKARREFIRATARKVLNLAWQDYQKDADSPTLDGFVAWRPECIIQRAGLAI